jgi:hypothetical protein
MWEPRLLAMLWASTARYGDSFVCAWGYGCQYFLAVLFRSVHIPHGQGYTQCYSYFFLLCWLDYCASLCFTGHAGSSDSQDIVWSIYCSMYKSVTTSWHKNVTCVVVLVWMIGFISTVTHSLLITLKYSSTAPLLMYTIYRPPLHTH